jgi:hypothetical protein
MTSCATLQARLTEADALIQAYCNASLPSDFNDTITFDTTNPYFTLTIKATGVQKKDGRWVYQTLSYRRTGFGGTTLTVGTQH